MLLIVPGTRLVFRIRFPKEEGRGVGGHLCAPTLSVGSATVFEVTDLTQPLPSCPALDSVGLRARLRWAGFLILPPAPCGLGQAPLLSASGVLSLPTRKTKGGIIPVIQGTRMVPRDKEHLPLSPHNVEA